MLITLLFVGLIFIGLVIIFSFIPVGSGEMLIEPGDSWFSPK
jgi:uncharacterized protein YqfA (UPF0365 family)